MHLKYNICLVISNWVSFTPTTCDISFYSAVKIILFARSFKREELRFPFWIKFQLFNTTSHPKSVAIFGSACWKKRINFFHQLISDLQMPSYVRQTAMNLSYLIKCATFRWTSCIDCSKFECLSFYCWRIPISNTSNPLIATQSYIVIQPWMRYTIISKSNNQYTQKEICH